MYSGAPPTSSVYAIPGGSNRNPSYNNRSRYHSGSDYLQQPQLSYSSQNSPRGFNYGIGRGDSYDMYSPPVHRRSYTRTGSTPLNVPPHSHASVSGQFGPAPLSVGIPAQVSQYSGSLPTTSYLDRYPIGVGTSVPGSSWAGMNPSYGGGGTAAMDGVSSVMNANSNAMNSSLYTGGLENPRQGLPLGYPATSRAAYSAQVSPRQRFGGPTPASARLQAMRAHRSLEGGEHFAGNNPIGAFDDFSLIGGQLGLDSQFSSNQLPTSYGQPGAMNTMSHSGGPTARTGGGYPLMSSLSTSNLFNSGGHHMTAAYDQGGLWPPPVSSGMDGLGMDNANFGLEQSLNYPGGTTSMAGAGNSFGLGGIGSVDTIARGLPPFAQQQYMLQHQALMARLPPLDPTRIPHPTLIREYQTLRHQYDQAVQKFNQTMTSIKNFWSPELKKERQLRKEEAQKVNLMQEQLRLASHQSHRQTGAMKHLQDELHHQYEITRTFRDTDIQSVPRDEYDATRMEKERLMRELTLMRTTQTELNVQIESQRQTLMARDDSIRKLLDMLQSKGLLPYNAAQDRVELEHSRGRIIELENQCRHLEQQIEHRSNDVISLQQECVTASEKLRHLQMQYDRLKLIHPGGTMVDDHQPQQAQRDRDPAAFQALVDSKDNRIAELERQLQSLEMELTHAKEAGYMMDGVGRELTDKSISMQEYSDLKSKVDIIEIEINHKNAELEAMRARLHTAEDQSNESRKHLEVVKEGTSNRDQTISYLQSDIEALRSKLEMKNEAIEQRSSEMKQLSQERQKLQSEIASMTEQLKMKDSKVTIIQRKVDSLEEMLKSSQQQLELTRQRLQAAPAFQQQQQMQDQIDQLSREQERLILEVKREREHVEQEKMEEVETHSREVKNLKQTIDMLQKELTDKQVLVESYSSKIEDMESDLATLKIRADVGGRGDPRNSDLKDREIVRLQDELHTARGEVDRLLKMISAMEFDRKEYSSKIKDVEDSSKRPFTSTSSDIISSLMTSSSRQLRDAKGNLRRSGDSSSLGTSLSKISPSGSTDVSRVCSDTLRQSMVKQRDGRIEELEEALRESVSITAEREYANAQQKQLLQQCEVKAQQYRDEISRLKRQLDEVQQQLTILKSTQSDRDHIVKSLQQERKRHLEEVLQLKEEALVAAISEKDAHIALVEMHDHKSPDEIETLRMHKDRLIKKLKEENAKRVRLMQEQKDEFSSTPLARELKSSAVEQIVQAVKYVEFQKKKLTVFIDQLIAFALEIDSDLLNGLPRTQQWQGVDVKHLKKLTHPQLLSELQQREKDSATLQLYANQLLQKLVQVRPEIARRTLLLLDSFDPLKTHVSARHVLPSTSAMRNNPTVSNYGVPNALSITCNPLFAVANPNNPLLPHNTSHDDGSISTGKLPRRFLPELSDLYGSLTSLISPERLRPLPVRLGDLQRHANTMSFESSSGASEIYYPRPTTKTPGLISNYAVNRRLPPSRQNPPKDALDIIQFLGRADDPLFYAGTPTPFEHIPQSTRTPFSNDGNNNNGNHYHNRRTKADPRLPASEYIGQNQHNSKPPIDPYREEYLRNNYDRDDRIPLLEEAGSEVSPMVPPYQISPPVEHTRSLKQRSAYPPMITLNQDETISSTQHYHSLPSTQALSSGRSRSRRRSSPDQDGRRMNSGTSGSARSNNTPLSQELQSDQNRNHPSAAESVRSTRYSAAPNSTAKPNYTESARTVVGAAPRRGSGGRQNRMMNYENAGPTSNQAIDMDPRLAKNRRSDGSPTSRRRSLEQDNSVVGKDGCVNRGLADNLSNEQRRPNPAPRRHGRDRESMPMDERDNAIIPTGRDGQSQSRPIRPAPGYRLASENN